MTGHNHKSELDDALKDLLIEAVPDCAIHWIDANGLVASWNGGAQRLQGYPAGAIIGRHFSIFCCEDALAADVPGQSLAAALKNGRFETEGWCLRQDGSRFWAQTLIQGGPGGNIAGTGFARIVRCLTPAKAIDRRPGGAFQSMESERRYREIFNNSSDGIFLLEVVNKQRFRLEDLNPAAERIALLYNDNLRGKLIEDLFPFDRARNQIANCQACLEAGAAIRYEEAVQFQTAERKLHTSLIPIHRADGLIHRIMGIVQDVTKEHQLRAVQAELEGYFRTLVENSPDSVVRFDRHCRRIYANPTHEQISGIPNEIGIGTTPTELAAFGSMSASRLQELFTRVLDRGVAEELKVDFMLNGEDKHFLVRASPERDASGAIVSVLAVSRDMTDRIRVEKQLQHREQVYRTLVENSPNFIARFDREGRCLYANPAMQLQIGAMSLPPDHKVADPSPLMDPGAVAAKAGAVLKQGAIQELEVCYRTLTGDLRWGHARLAPEFDEFGNVVSILIVSHDITELVESRDKINRLAFHDALTGLPNRSSLSDYAQTLMVDRGKGRAAFGLMMLDLDRFKEVNDTLGHAAGDILLREIAQRLRCCLREEDMVARLGGDEFTILLPSLSSQQRLAGVAVRILRALTEPIRLGDRDVAISASIGISRYPEDSQDFQEILKNADAAMHKAKSTGRNTYHFYDAEMMARIVKRMMIEAPLKKALQRNEFELHYQPQILLPSDRLVGAEALLRWHHPDLGLITPDKFIAIAEETGLIVEIGQWVIEMACRVVAEWNRERNEPLIVSANISSRQVTHGDLSAVVMSALAATGCKAQWLCLEITESLLLEDKGRVKATLNAMKQMGVSIAVDDFGTGYSALSYLSNFPIDVLKIDQSFIREMGADHRKTELVKAIIAIAKALELKLVAEGVETQQHSEFLKANDCLIAQGYLHGKPMPEDAFSRMFSLARRERRVAS